MRHPAFPISAALALLATAVFPPAASAAASAIVKDNEGNEYATVVIGGQTWMKENLRAAKYRNGDPIGTTDPPDKGIAGEAEARYQWPAQGTDSGLAAYGRLYTWHAATDDRGVCPTGFEVPTHAQWTALTDRLGGLAVAGTALKEAGSAHWQETNTGTNSSGFTARGAGTRETSGSIGGMDAGFWTSDRMMSGYAYYRRVYGYKAEVTAPGQAMGVGYSIRCIQVAASAGEPTGLKDNFSPDAAGFRFLPGPGRGAWRVDGVAAGAELLVVDLRGRHMASAISRDGGRLRLDLRHARPGVYLAQVRTATGVLTRPLVLE